jgi:hypothetical protein
MGDNTAMAATAVISPLKPYEDGAPAYINITLYSTI